MKSYLYAFLFLLTANCAVAQTPVTDTNNLIKPDGSYFIIDKCKIRGTSVTGTTVKNPEIILNGTPANCGDIQIRGQRGDSCYYYIDGIKVRGSANLPEAAVEEVTVITGGLPVHYGDSYPGCIIQINCPPKAAVTPSDKEQKMATE